MAARRLILVLVVLLGLSVVAAALAPDRGGFGPTSEDSTTTVTTPEPAVPAGELVRSVIAADAADPATVRAQPGDQIDLSVTSEDFRQIEITPFGLLEPSTPNAPARFNFLLRDPGAIPITDAEDGEVIGRILVDPDEGGTAGERKQDSGSTAPVTSDAMDPGNA